jgi:tetratricopeptide (TPR) repeat protein
MDISRIVRRVLLGASLGWSGCVTVPDPSPTAAQSAPANPSRWDRLLRRTSVAVPTTSAIPSAPRDPQDPGRLSLAYARLMEQSGDLTQAEQHYRRALEETPESLDALVGLGRVHLLGGRHDAAVEAFEAALQSDPKFGPALHGLGQAASARKNWSVATELLAAAVEAEPENTSFRYDLAVVMVEAGDVEGALPHFIRTVGDAEAHYNAGLILQRAGRLPESELQLQQALAKNPDLAEARYWLTTIQQQQQLPTAPPKGLAGRRQPTLDPSVARAGFHASAP